jgi:hypothetical protein
VPTPIIDPNFPALQKALETFGGQGPNESAIVRKIWAFQKTLLNQAS